MTQPILLLWLIRLVVRTRCDGFALLLKAALLSDASAAVWNAIWIHCPCVEYTSKWAETMVAPFGMVTPAKRNPAKLAVVLLPFPIQMVEPLVVKLVPSSLASSAAALIVNVTVCGPLACVAVLVAVGVLVDVAVAVAVLVAVEVAVAVGVLVDVAVGTGV